MTYLMTYPKYIYSQLRFGYYMYTKELRITQNTCFGNAIGHGNTQETVFPGSMIRINYMDCTFIIEEFESYPVLTLQTNPVGEAKEVKSCHIMWTLAVAHYTFCVHTYSANKEYTFTL